MTPDMTKMILGERDIDFEMIQGSTLKCPLVRGERTLSPSGANSQSVRHGLRALRYAVMIALMIVGVNGVWGQSLPFVVTTANDVSNHTEKFYWIESVGGKGFHIVPNSDNTYASTTNAPTMRALWYFMESGESGYYYIINKETGTYLKRTGNAGADSSIGVANYAAADDSKFKFSFDTPEGITQGSWVIYPKDTGSSGWVGKKSGNLEFGKWLKVSNYGNTPVGDLNSQWIFVARNDVQWPQSGLPFVVSTNNDKHFYNINHVNNSTYNVSYDNSNYVTISTEDDDKKVWYFKEAAADPNIDNLKYYYIINASSEKYLKFTATTINGSNQNDKFVLSDYDSGNEDRFQFVVVNSYDKNGYSWYSIMPKLAMSKYDVSNFANSMTTSTVENNEKLDLRCDRNTDKGHWVFVSTVYPSSCSTPTITYSSETGKITITSTPADADIHYTIDGVTEPSSSLGTLYSAPFDVSSSVTIKAIATKTGYDPSNVATVSFDQVTAPTIQNDGSNAISITCATEDATIYYTLDGSTPTTASTEYTTPLTENVSGVTIKAIAVKDGMINSTTSSNSVTLQCAKPVLTKSGNSVTITCDFPSSGVSIYYTKNGGDPSSSSTLYNGAISVTLHDVIKAIAVASGYDDSPVATKIINNDLEPTDGKYLINSQTDFDTFVDMVNEGGASYHYVLKTNVDAGSEISQPFTGIFEVDADENGNYYTISSLTHPLFNTINGGTVKNVMLKGVTINKTGHVGAIAGVASGYSRIYNCGILPSNNNYNANTETSYLQSSDGYCGGLVGSLKDDSRVINCFSYANIMGGTDVAGIVGHNDEVYASEEGVSYGSTTEVNDGKYYRLKTAVVNCMFYGNISGGSKTYPVYGGAKMVNNTATGINNYDFYRANASVGTLEDYNCSWPAKEEYLTQYEFYRNLLNSNRELCGWWVGAASAPSAMTTTEVQAVPKNASLMAKWVLDPSIAPYPILKLAGRYPSVINRAPRPDETNPQRIDPETKQWVSRTSSTNTEMVNPKAAPETDGQSLGKITVKIKKNANATSTDKQIIITAMDIENNDFCYGKIQLPYYNSIFGDPTSDDWDVKYGGNYGTNVVVGWEISVPENNNLPSITNQSGTDEKGIPYDHTYSTDAESGYNFVDRYCTTKDENRVFAQGGYYYVPYGVSEITITAKWATAYYLSNTDRYYDRISVTSLDTSNPQVASSTLSPFTPAGQRPTTLDNGKTVYTTALSSTIPNGSVYEKAIVLVGNHQQFKGSGNIGNANNGCTIMSADFDMDEEPDYCLIWQLGTKTDRQSFCPIRFDFLPVVEMGLAMKEDASLQYYSLGCYRPLGHFEVTETSLIHFGQFEFGNTSRTTKIDPLILNGGIYDQYTKGPKGNDATLDCINYIIIGGNVRMPSFTPGAHPASRAEALKSTRHCPVNVMGGDIDYIYLTGNYNDNITPYTDNPHCYIDGGYFKQVAAAGKEGIDGDVYFKINHSKIDEFYGGSTMDQATGYNFKTVKGNISVTIDNSKVDKYCGGPKFGDMNHANNKTITTNATGTTFGVFYGGGNGGTSYVQYTSTDYTNNSANTSYDWSASNRGNLTNYSPGSYRTGNRNYMADYDMEIVNTSTGTIPNQAIFRTYFYAAQFSATNTGSITNHLTDCTVLTNFYGGGNLGGVMGSVTSTLDGTTHVYGSAFGAGFSATVPEVTIQEKEKTAPVIDINTGIITPQSGGYGNTYTWCGYKDPSTKDEVVPSGVVIPNGVGTGSPSFQYMGHDYYYTEVPLDNLGAVSGAVTLTIKGTTTIDGSVYGGGNASAVINTTNPAAASTTVNLQGNATVFGNVFGGGNEGKVSGSATVNVEE